MLGTAMGRLGMYARFARDLGRFLGERPPSVEECRREVSRRLKDREEALLSVVRDRVYGNPASPYLPLLRLAGCEFGDFENMVRSGGAEPALEKLSGEGVYLTVDEFKCKTPVVRGGREFRFSQQEFDNPFVTPHLETRTGASRSAGTRTLYEFDFLEANWVRYIALMIDDLGATALPYAFWYPVMPGAGPAVLLAWSRAGLTPERWFSPVSLGGFGASLHNRLGTAFIIAAGRLAGRKWPRPEHVGLDSAKVVARWAGEAIGREGGCLLNTYTSAAVRVCQAARAERIDLTGMRIISGGEPITEAKRGEMEASGARVYPVYGSMDGGIMAFACTRNTAPDEVHLCADSMALVQKEREVPHAGVTVGAFLMTTLLPSSPKILLNVESGDYGVQEERDCGCFWQALGLTRHLHAIRAYDKLTSQGMTFIGTDMVRIIEQVLPARFGGGSTDYQMVEEEGKDGHTRMSILVSPEVGEVDEEAVVGVVLEELSRGQDHHRLMADVWAQAKTLRVVRSRPIPTARGKLLPLHIMKTKA